MKVMIGINLVLTEIGSLYLLTQTPFFLLLKHLLFNTLFVFIFLYHEPIIKLNKFSEHGAKT
jgi:hypothetical protein